MTLTVFVRYAFQGHDAWPSVVWTESQDASGDYVLAVKTEIPVQTALLWTAHSETKDFRKATWESRDVTQDLQAETIQVKIPKPENGHVAFYLEMESEFEGAPFSITTQVFRK